MAQCRPTSAITVPTPPTYCCDISLSQCVFYDGPTLCIATSQNAYLNQVLQELSIAICAQNPSFLGYNFQCLSSYAIQNEDDFISAVIDILCKIVDEEFIDDITSLSSVQDLITELTVDVNALNSFTLLTCFQTLTGSGSPLNLANTLQTIQTAICDLNTAINSVDDKLVKIAGSDTTSGYLIDKLVPGLNVTFTVLNPGANEKIRIDSAPGLYGSVLSEDTNTVDVIVSGVDNHTVSAIVKLSTTAGNLLKLGANGLYISAEDFLDAVIADVTITNDICTTCAGLTTTTTTTTTSTTTTTTTAAPTTTTTTTTTTAAPTTTTTTSTTTTTTTAPPEVDITNTLPNVSITNVTGIAGFTLPETVEPGERITGSHDAFSATVAITIQGFATIAGNLRVYVNLVEQPTCQNIPSGLVNQTYNFAITVNATDQIRIAVGSGAC